VPLVFGLLIGFGALILRLNQVAFGEPRGPAAPAQASYVPMYAHLLLVFVPASICPAARCLVPECRESSGVAHGKPHRRDPALEPHRRSRGRAC
jgi:hypothetical protein